MKTIPVRKIKADQSLQNTAGRFRILDLQQILSGTDLHHELHKHDFYFVLAVLKGKGKHEIDFVDYPVHDHSIFILRPGQVHRLQLKAGSKGFLMEFDLSFYQPKINISEHRWKKAISRNYCKVDAARFDKLYISLTSLFDEYRMKEEGYVEAIKARLDIFFIEYIRQSRNPSRLSKTGTAYMQERFEELAGLLESNIVSMKNVSQYAELLNLSSYQLNAITKASVGKTASELINDQVILEAKRQLLATTIQVKEIAAHLGYEDPSYFIRFFKRQTGLSPELFRRNFK